MKHRPPVTLAAPASVPAPRAEWLAKGLVVLAVMVAFANSFSVPLLLDDYYSITENRTIRQLWPPGPAFSPPEKSGTGGRPVANFSFAVSYALSGTKPWGHHAVSVAVHALAALALFGVVRRTLRQPALHERFGRDAVPLAALIAVLWAVHPLQTQVVSYVSQRTESLMALFYLLTLYGFIRGVEAYPRRWHGLAIAACLLGMASKEVMVTAPVMVLLYDRVFVAGSWGEIARRRGWFYAGLAATWLLLAWLLVGVNARDVGYGLGVTVFDYALTQCKAVVLYVRLALWPQPLVFDRGPLLVKSLAEAWPWMVALVGIIAATGWAGWRRSPAVWAAGWFFIVLAPASSVVPVVQQPIAENRVHLALAGVVALVVLGLHARLGRGSFVVAGGLALACVLGTLSRNRDFSSEVGIWRDTVAKAPGNVRAHHNLGAELQKSGQPAEAVAAFEYALTLDPRYHTAHVSLGNVFLELGRNEDAVRHYRRAVEIEPGQPKAYVNFGIALHGAGQPKEALVQFERAVVMESKSADALYNLGTALVFAGRFPEAIERLRAAVALDPRQAKAWSNLGLALQHAGDLAAAMEQFERAIQVDPTYAEAHTNLGNALGNAGRYAEAITRWEAALRLDPQLHAVRANIARARQLRDEQSAKK